jgi:hypothetical protein
MAVEANFKIIGMVGVDTGQLLITDPAYTHRFANDEADSDLKPGASPLEIYGYSYSGACAASSNAERGGQLGKGEGVCISSGAGDGIYPVFAEYDDKGRVERVVIEFFSE